MKPELAKSLEETGKNIELELSSLPSSLRKMRDEAGNPFPLSSPIPDRSELVIPFITRVRDVARITSPSNLGAVASTIPNSQLQILNQKFRELLDSIRAFAGTVRSNEKFRAIDPNNFVLIDQAGTSQDMRAQLYQAYDRVEEILNQNATSYLLRRIKDKDREPDAATEFRSLIKDVSGEFTKVAQARSELDQMILAQKNRLEEIQASAAEISRLSEQSQRDRKTIQEYSADSSASFSAIKQTAEGSQELEAAMASFKPKLSDFRNSIGTREAEIEQGKRALAALISQLNEENERIESLISRGESMLSLTTTAGLSSNYLTTVQKLTRELMWSRVSFYLGIAVLFISAAPLFANAVIPILVAFYPDLQAYAEGIVHASGQQGWQYFAQVFARLIILVPAAWLISFSAKRHSLLFKLREHYTYKYSLAASVEGFKKEAEKYGDEIAATVFEELAFNPADRLDHSDLETHRPPNPFLQKMLDLIQNNEQKK